MTTKKIQSIHSQLTIFYSVAVVSLLVLIAFAFYWETQNVMNEADYNFVTDEASNIQAMMSEDHLDLSLLKKSVIDHPILTRNSLYRYYVRVFDKNGQVIMETPGFDGIIAAPTKVQLEHDQQQGFIWGAHGGDDYLTNVVPVVLSDGAQHGYVQVSLDTSYQHTITHDRRIFVGLLLLGMFLSLLLGKYVTSRGLKSLDILTDTVKTISTSSLNQRVNPALLPKELTTLGESFNQMLDRIETSFARMHQMSADMSHELRTPITNLIGQTELLLSYNHSEGDYRLAQSSNLEELQRMASLVENILFLARAESQQPAIIKETISVSQETSKISEYYQALADDKNISITQKGEASLHVNVIMFKRLLSNLISNAVKYTPAHGAIEIVITQQAESVLLSIADNGIGIDAEHLPKLFDRFYRVDDSRSAEISGTGLGLSIVKSIVDLHHGSIAIQSISGAGATINITLPT